MTVTTLLTAAAWLILARIAFAFSLAAANGDSPALEFKSPRASRTERLWVK